MKDAAASQISEDLPLDLGAAVIPAASSPRAPNEDDTLAEAPENKQPPPFICDQSQPWYCNGKIIWPHKCALRGCYSLDPGTGRDVCNKTTTIACGFDKCSAVSKTAGQFSRHYRTVHIRAAKCSRFNCTIEGCHRVGEEGFTRKDNLTQHMRKVHGEAIPKNRVRFNGWQSDGKPSIEISQHTDIDED